jgi:hypothetical protein
MARDPNDFTVFVFNFTPVHIASAYRAPGSIARCSIAMRRSTAVPTSATPAE